MLEMNNLTEQDINKKTCATYSHTKVTENDIWKKARRNEGE